MSESSTEPRDNIASPSNPALPPDVAAQVGIPRPAVGSFILPPEQAVLRQHEGPVTIPAPPPREIPPGMPSAVAGVLAASVVGAIDADVVQKLAQLDTDLMAAIEAARIYPNDRLQGLVPVVQSVGWLLQRRAALIAKQSGKPPATAAAVASECCASVLSVARFSSGDGLRVERARRLGSLKSELAQCESSLQSLLAFPPHTHGGAMAQEAMVKERTTALLELKRRLTDRIVALDGSGPTDRGKLVGKAIAQAGGASKLAVLIGRAMPADHRSREIDSLIEKVSRIDGQLASIDPDSERAGMLRDQRAQLARQRAHIASASLEARQLMAAKLLADATAGSLDALGALAPFAADVSSDLAAAVAQARGTDDDLAIVTGEILFVAELARDRPREARRTTAPDVRRPLNQQPFCGGPYDGIDELD